MEDARDFISCLDCSAEGPMRMGQGSESSIEAWNCRSTDAQLADLRRKWLGHRDTGHLSLIEAADRVIGGLHDEIGRLEAEFASLKASIQAPRVPAVAIWCKHCGEGTVAGFCRLRKSSTIMPMDCAGLATPTPAETAGPQPLTDADIESCWPTRFAMPNSQRRNLFAFARAVIERAHGICAIAQKEKTE
jgi:hypothetical protein